MKHLADLLCESWGSTEVRDRKLRKLLDAEGLNYVSLYKANGYFYISANENATTEQYDFINRLPNTSIYMNAFSHQSAQDWLSDIMMLINK